jgi:hypothetical protein
VKTQKNEQAENAGFFARIEKLKLSKNWTWEQAAKELQISRMMLHRIKTAKSGVSNRNLHRLEQLEIQEGLKPPGAKQLVDALVSGFEEAKVELTAGDFDRGFVEVPIDYARGEPPKGYPAVVRLARPDVKTSGKIIAELLVDEDYEKVLLNCIQPSSVATQGFLNLLTPFSYQALTEAAMALVFGVHWRQKLGKKQQRT